MNSNKIIDAFGRIDDELIEKVELLRKKKRVWLSRGAMVACFVLLVTVSWIALKHTFFMRHNNTDPSIELNETQEQNVLNMNVEKMIYLNHRLYSPNAELTQMVTQENLGKFVGYVSFDGKNETLFSAYMLLGIGEGNSVAVDYNGMYYVYMFHSFVPDGSEEWPVNLLENSDYIEVRDPNYGIDNEIVYHILSNKQDVENMLEMISALGEKHNQIELNQRYYERYKDSFTDDELWIDENGNICTSSVEVGMYFNELVCGTDRKIVVIMKDGAELSYSYLPGAGVILCDTFAYFLSDEQVSRINHMIDLQ